MCGLDEANNSVIYFNSINMIVKQLHELNDTENSTMGHFIFRWNQSLKPWFETRP